MLLQMRPLGKVNCLNYCSVKPVIILSHLHQHQLLHSHAGLCWQAGDANINKSNHSVAKAKRDPSYRTLMLCQTRPCPFPFRSSFFYLSSSKGSKKEEASLPIYWSTRPLLGLYWQMGNTVNSFQPDTQYALIWIVSVVSKSVNMLFERYIGNGSKYLFI